ncbi:hypothetical protein [Geobacter pickeringii]|uniref:hypothetical protein n=1 Tax=Geobacter pickeringii TaxID=345632 RepID=UPI001185724B|nr:hypothetical protein [Geobacter pickeringii]
MNDTKLIRDPNCQLQVLPDAAEALAVTDRLRLLGLRLLRAMERRLGGPAGLRAAVPASDVLPPASPGEAIEEGDWVRVRSLAEIRATLGASQRCKGLEFMPGMEQFCDRRMRVRKKVRTMFDERAWRMIRIRDCFLLDDCVCEGRGMFDKEGCDRCCYYFWKDSWLVKMN